MPRFRPFVLFIAIDRVVDKCFSLTVLMKLALELRPILVGVVQVFGPVSQRDVRHLGLLFFGDFEHLFHMGISFRSLLLPPASVRVILIFGAELGVVIHLADVVVGGPGS